MNWEEWFERRGPDNLMVHDWPEHGPGSVQIEDLYQAFKARLLAELQSGHAEYVALRAARVAGARMSKERRVSLGPCYVSGYGVHIAQAQRRRGGSE